MNIKLTKEEVALIKKLRTEEATPTPTKGVLKHDLYHLDLYSPEIHIPLNDVVDRCGWYLDEEAKNLVLKIAQDVVNDIFRAPALRKGAPFLKEAHDDWFDDVNGTIQGMDDAWASKHLDILP